jgi:hypothetical protein
MVGLVCGAALIIIGAAAYADEIKVKGDVIHGKVTGLYDGAVTLETPDIGKDQKLVVPFELVEDIRTDGQLQILHGDEQETVGRIAGFQDGRLLVGSDTATATAVELKTVHSAVAIGAEVAWVDRMRSRFRYWDGFFEFGVGLSESTTDSTSLMLGFSATRKKAPTRLFFDVAGRYGKEETDEFSVGPDPSTPNPNDAILITETRETRTQDNLKGRARGEYDLMARLYAFASGDAEYDGVQRLSIRGVPKAGLGYKIWETKTSLFQVEAGGAWVYEQYFGGEDDNFFSVAFGSYLDTDFWYGSRFFWRMDYLPAVDDWAGNYLLRNEMGLFIPVWASLNLKLSLIDIYDSTPARQDFDFDLGPMEDIRSVKVADNNQLFFALGLAFTF